MHTQETFYRSKEWQRFRDIVIADRTNQNGYVICEWCGKPIVKKYDLIIDHIKELSDDNVNDASIALNPDNVRCLHASCHNKRHERFGSVNYMNRRKKVYVVYGPPCAGKYDHVCDRADPADLIVDMDSIYQMISANKRYKKPDRLNSIVFSIRNSLYNDIKYRNGKWHDAYIITTAPKESDRTILKKRVNADEFIFIDTPKEECLLIAKDRGIDSKYVIDWFDEYEPDTVKESPPHGFYY